MRKLLAAGVLTAVTVSQAVAWSLSGTVVDLAGQALAGVRVEHVCSGIADTTDGSGVFLVTDVSGVSRSSIDRVSMGFVSGRGPVFDLVGRRLSDAQSRESGVRMGVAGRSTGVYVRASRRGTETGATKAVHALPKQAACTGDTLVLSKSGYVVKSVVPAASTGLRVVLQQSGVIDVTVQQAKALIDNNTSNSSFVILDIRTASEFASGHIAGAINIDYYDPTFQTQIAALDRTKIYVVHCRSGARSGSAMPVFESLNFQTVHNMLGGMNAWVAAGYPVVQ